MLIRIKNHIFSLRERVELLILYGVIMFVLGMGLNHMFTKPDPAITASLQSGPYMRSSNQKGPNPVVDVDTSGLPSALPGEARRVAPPPQREPEPIAPKKQEGALKAPINSQEADRAKDSSGALNNNKTEQELLKQVEDKTVKKAPLEPQKASAFFVSDKVKGVTVPAPHKPLTYTSRMVPVSKPIDDVESEKAWRGSVKKGYEEIAQQLVSSKKIDRQMQKGQGDAEKLKVAGVASLDDKEAEKLAAISPALGASLSAPMPAQHQISALSLAGSRTTDSIANENIEIANTTSGKDASSSHIITKTIKVKRGDSISKILNKNGVPSKRAYIVSEELDKVFDIRKLRVGNVMTLKIKPIDNEISEFVSMRIHGKITEYVVWKNQEGKLKSAEEEKNVKRKRKHAAGVIKTNLSLLASSLNVPKAIVANVINLYSYQVDFSRDISSGAVFEVIYDEVYNDKGEYLSHGNLLYASIDVQGDPMRIYRYEHGDGKKGYYDETGRSIRKSLTRTPIHGATISSHFGYRKHPIYKRKILHKGTDFAAPRGTPVYAAGDGVVDFIGRNGGYGKFVKLKHNREYKTAYAHLSRFAKGMRKGKRVKQGQVIAYVGSTGASTGPHLHYEIIKKGKHINPMKAKLSPGKRLTGNDMDKFKKLRTQYGALLAKVRGERKAKIATAISE